MDASVTFSKWLLVVEKTDLLILDDWGLTALPVSACSDLMELIDDP